MQSFQQVEYQIRREFENKSDLYFPEFILLSSWAMMNRFIIK